MWNNRINELNIKRQIVIDAGGGKKIEKQHLQGKLTARERIYKLLDSNSFVELNSMMSSRIDDFDMSSKKVLGDGVITGYGKINGRLVYVSSQDFTIIGGSLGEAHAKKICNVIDKALELKVPYISINDSGGARIEEGIDSLNGYGNIFYRNVKASGIIPQISIILGPCAGGACYSPAITDFIYMSNTTSQMYITGPQVVKAVIGEDISGVKLGGAQVHSSISGVAHFSYDNDIICLENVRRLFDYIPNNNEEIVERTKFEKEVSLRKINLIVPDNPKKPYDMIEVINEIFDKNTFFEIQKEFARNILIGFAKLSGYNIGIVANQPNYLGGSLDCDSSDKASRFIRFCDCFNIPIISLVDVPAYMPGSIQEYKGIIRHGAKLLYAFSESTVGKVCIILRKAYGGAYIAMNSKSIGADFSYAWPIAEIAVMGSEAAIKIIKKKELADDSSEQNLNRLVNEYNEKFMNPYIATTRGYIDEVIFPEETRKVLISSIEQLQYSHKKPIYKKHGNIPL